MLLRGRRLGFIFCWVAWSAMQLLPLAHQLQHARAHVERLQHVAAQADHVHTSDAGLSAALDGVGHQVTACLTCTTVLSAVPNQTAATHEQFGRTLLASAMTGRFVPTASSTQSIRAPPVTG